MALSKAMIKEINILMLGETGVGKSTFINAFANYLTFSTLDEAWRREIVILIPTMFTVTDDNYQEQQVRLWKTIGPNNPNDVNEVQEVGKSATQACRCYEFPFKDFIVRIIDTPGIGDARGVDTDKANMANVMATISNYQVIHAICILMKPDNQRLTASFKFCVSQLLCHLSKLATSNIVFVFTNAKTTNYRPRGSLSLLRMMFDEMASDVRIELTKDRLYCFDNEAFNFIGAVKKGIRMSDDDRESCEKSWRKASEECSRLIKRIIGDEHTPGFVPHNVMHTVLVNDARNLIVALTEPLAEITQNIQDNLKILNQRKQELDENKNDIDNLKKKLFVPSLEIEYVELEAPAAVCDHDDCCEYYYVAGIRKKHRKQKCHLVCEPGPIVSALTQVLFGDSAMYWCNAMDASGYCKVCRHHFSSHLKVNTESRVVEKQVEDEAVRGLLDDKEDGLSRVEKIVSDIEKRSQVFTQEQKDIVSATAKFACFLRKNAIAGFNDAFGEHLKTEIENARMLTGRGANNRDEIRRLEGMLRQYQEEMAIYKKTLDSDFGGQTSAIDPNEIMETVKKLFRLELNGKKIKEAYDKKKGPTNPPDQSKVTYHPTGQSMLGTLESAMTRLATSAISKGLSKIGFK